MNILQRIRSLANLSLYFALFAAISMAFNLSAFEAQADWLVISYVPLAFIGQAFVMGLLIFIVFLLPVIVLPKRLFALMFALVVGVAAFLLVVDSWLFSVYRYHLNAFFLKMFFTDLNGIGLTWVTVALIFLGQLATVVGVYLLSQFTFKAMAISRPLKAYLALFVLTFAGQVLHAYGYAHNMRRVVSLTHVIPMYYPLIAEKEVRSLGLFDESKVEEGLKIEGGSVNGFNYPKEPIQCSGDAKPNIVVISLESWRFDRLTPDVTPNIYALGQASLMFTNHLSTGSVTDRGLFGLFYGVSAAYIESALGAGSSPAIMQAVDQLGYQQWVIANQDIEVNRLTTLLFPNVEPIQSLGERKVHEGDIGVVEQFNQLVAENGDEPFFSFMLFNASHFPYWTPPDYSKPFEPSERFAPSKADDDTKREPYFNQYSNAIHFNDSLVKLVVDQLKSLNLLDNTIIVVTGDHGEEFKDQDEVYWGHGSNFSRYQVGVPLVIHWPGKEAAVFNHRTSHEDIMGTLVTDALDCSVPLDAISTGESLFDDIPRVNIIESYVNQGIVVDDIVTELYPGFVVSYDLDDITEDAKVPGRTMKGVQKVYSQFR